jgi:transposase-like protein
MTERGVDVDHSKIARWVLHFGPILDHLIRHETRCPNRWWRVDETLYSVCGPLACLCRAIDWAGSTIDFLLSPNRDLVAAKGFLQLAVSAAPLPPRGINVDGHPAYATAIAELKASGELSPKCRCRPSPYLNNIIEQDHRFVKKRITASQGFRSVQGALSTIVGYAAMNAIRKGQFRWSPKGEILGQKQFIERLFGFAA